jgi:hypothetical protein
MIHPTLLLILEGSVREFAGFIAMGELVVPMYG